jgi:hypothetical protein
MLAAHLIDYRPVPNAVLRPEDVDLLVQKLAAHIGASEGAIDLYRPIAPQPEPSWQGIDIALRGVLLIRLRAEEDPVYYRGHMRLATAGKGEGGAWEWSCKRFTLVRHHRGACLQSASTA